MNNKYIIYGLFELDSGELRYIGKTIRRLNTRFNTHLSVAKSPKSKTYLSKWIRFNNYRNNIEIRPIQELYNLNDLNEAEIYWIKHFKYLGCNLVNCTSGGEGVIGFKHNSDFKKKMSQLMYERHNKNTAHKIVRRDRRNKLSEIQEQELIFNYINNISNTELAKKYKITKTTVLNILKRHGVRTRHRVSRPFKDQFGTIYNTHKEASIKLKIAAGSVCEVLKNKKQSAKGYEFFYI